MNTPLRLLLHALGSLVLALAVLTVPSPAGAAITRLCTGYTSCANAGMGSAGYAQASGQMYWRMYSGHNCTNYAAYRVIKNGYSSTRPWDGSGNATYWGSEMSGITDRTPAVGAIAWWRAGVYPAGSAGHVAYVEKVISPTEIIISQDSWGGDFSWARITSTSGWPSGFIHFNDQKPVMNNVKRPTVSGDLKVGETLEATRGGWRPRGADVVYQWRSGGEAIQTGSLNTLEVGKALLGKRVKVKVIASKSGYVDASARRTAPPGCAPAHHGQHPAPARRGHTRGRPDPGRRRRPLVPAGPDPGLPVEGRRPAGRRSHRTTPHPHLRPGRQGDDRQRHRDARGLPHPHRHLGRHGPGGRARRSWSRRSR